MVKFITTLMLALLLISCRSVRYVPIEHTRTDTLYQSVVQYDSINAYKHIIDSITRVTVLRFDTLMHDSVYVYQHEDGTKEVSRLHKEKIYITKIDSIYNRSKMLDMERRYKQEIDSLRRCIADSTQVPVPVEKPLKFVDRLFLGFGKIFIGLFIIGVIVISYYVVRSRK